MSVPWALRASVPRPSPCKGDALPTELSAQALHVSAPVVEDELCAMKKGLGGLRLGAASASSVRSSSPVGKARMAPSTIDDWTKPGGGGSLWQRRLGGLALRFGALEPTHALG